MTNLAYVKQKIEFFIKDSSLHTRVYSKDMKEVLMMLKMIIEEYEKGRVHEFLNGVRK